ncbi:neuralized-like protein 4 [Ptychodera flava]|uniref:neuralized-like protein 4 n=1 Tax=Ptychodera flava TaxID=63121 RepID=UPI00396A02C9
MGIRAGVKYGGKVAYRMDAEIDDVFNNKAVFLTNKPLKDNQMYEIKIDRFNSNLPFSLAMGVCMYSEFPEDVVYYGDGHGKGTGFWILRTGDFWQDFTHIGSSYPLNFENIKRGDRIGLARHSNGTLHYFLNGESKGIAFKNVPEGVFPVVAVTGKCLKCPLWTTHLLSYFRGRRGQNQEINRCDTSNHSLNIILYIVKKM